MKAEAKAEKAKARDQKQNYRSEVFFKKMIDSRAQLGSRTSILVSTNQYTNQVHV